jgi:hypothetical protein
MANLLIFIAEDGTPVQLTFFHRKELDGDSPGLWYLDVNEIYLCTENWEFLQSKKGNPHALKPMLDKLTRIRRSYTLVEPAPRYFYPKMEWEDYKN